ncbi:MAG TPA: hypothetical protein VM219_10480 [Phycisphaerae bacterium]|nr:hypothetical protein [Phycisphaerae bacterium]
MRFLRMLKRLFWGLLIKLFPSLGPKGVIDTQITVYKRLKAKFPYADENDILNSLILSRVNAPLSPSSTSEELAHYETLLESTDKTLEDVIWTIVEYEYLLSRGPELHRELAEVGAKPTDVAEEIAEWHRYIKERVAEMRTKEPKDSEFEGHDT